MTGFALVFLSVTYFGSLIFKDITHILFSIGFIICWYLDDILKELRKK